MANGNLHIGLIGVGLIGASLIGALRRAGVLSRVSGWDPDAEALRYALEKGLLDQAASGTAEAVQDAEIVVLATPPWACAELFATLAPVLRPGQVVTDTSSVKRAPIAAARAALGSLLPYYVPGHPIAGKEHNGPAAADPELFRGHDTILSPLPETDPAALRAIEDLWRHAGARVLHMEASRHDEIFAATSHLPHFLAYTLVDFLSSLEEENEIFKHAASGFADFTRIASSSPRMWSQICADNRDSLLPLLLRFEGKLATLRDLLQARDWKGLEARFRHAKRERDNYLEGRATRDGN